jgi:energy-coupling factor transporter transmembrane protein EcfT
MTSITLAADPRAPLARRNPTVKAALLLVVSLGVILLDAPAPLLVLWLLALTVGRWAAGLRWRTLLLAQLPFLLFAVGVVSVNALTRPGEPLLDAPVHVSAEGTVLGVAFALRGFVIGTGTIAFLASTPPRELMTSLVQHARLSPRYAAALLAGHRMLEAMPQRWAVIRAAQAVRAPVGRRGRPRSGVGGFARSAFALLVASIRSSERIALALESRGLGDGPRTIWRPVPLTRADALLAAAVPLAFAAVVAACALTLGWGAV